uniref:Uncharacterized protein n=1 Tax=Arundo donax TaxID=35708 RepID=A0A0A9F3Q9_ARUDO
MKGHIISCYKTVFSLLLCLLQELLLFFDQNTKIKEYLASSFMNSHLAF